MKRIKQSLGITLLLLGLFTNPLIGQPATPADTTKITNPTYQLSHEQKEEYDRLMNDWANLGRYRLENAQIGEPLVNETRVVFMGNSITQGWKEICPEFFAGRPYFDRGISGQTTPQMLIRFRQDAVNLKPQVVVILAGVNDIAGNTGPSTLEMIEDNLSSMVELAKANNIKAVLSSVLPANDFWWNPGTKPAEKIVSLNVWIKNYAFKNKLIYIDYYSPMVDGQLGLKKEYSEDGVHPNKIGYLLMAPLAEEAIQRALSQK